MTPKGTQYALFESAEAMPVELQIPAETGTGAQRFSDYVVYVDESGDHSLERIDLDYPVFVLANLTGLQLADLVARPIGLNCIRPEQANQAFDVLKNKFFCAGGRDRVGQGYQNIGLKIYPAQKAKSPGEPTEAAAPTRNPQST